MQKKYTFLFVSLLFIFGFNSVSGQQTVGLYKKGHESTPGYVLFSPNGYPAHYLIDKCGKLVKKWAVKNNPGLDAFLLPNGNLLSCGNVLNPKFPGQGSAGGLIEIHDWNDTLIWSYKLSDSLEMQNHDIYPMPNGNVLIAIWDAHSDSEALAMGRDSATGLGQWCAKVEEIQPIGKDSAKIVWQWRLWDHLVQNRDDGKPNYYGKISDHPELLDINFIGVGAGGIKADWIHLNSVTYNPDLDQVMISCREMCEFYVIDHGTTIGQAASHKGGKQGKGGDILYRWGNPISYGRGTSADQQLFVQHNATWIPKGYPDEGKILVFNDGTARPGGNFSTVDIITPPVDENGIYEINTGMAFGPTAPSWTYKAPKPTDFYSVVEGGVQRLPNGHTLVCESTKGNFFEIDGNDSIVWRYVNPVVPKGPLSQGITPAPLTNAVYRAELYDTAYAGFAGKTLVSGLPIELNPLSYTCSTVGIAPSQFSIKFNARVINPFCDVLSISTEENINNATVSIYDITGKCVENWKNMNIGENAQLQLDIRSDLKTGIYFLKIENVTGIFSSKLIHL